MRSLPHRFRERDFWITQAVVLGVTAMHVLAEVWALQTHSTVPTVFHHIPVVLYLIPISYGGLRYGIEGAVLTGLWSAALTLPNVLLWHQADYEWLELLYVAVVIVVGTVMSVPVDRERQERQRAEATIQRQVLLNDIARLTLAADLPTTLDETLRRLVAVLDLEAACVVVTDAGPRSELVVLACHPAATPLAGMLAGCLREDGATSRLKREASIVMPLSADPLGSGGGRVDGFLVARPNAARALTEDDGRLLAGVASHLAVGIVHDRLTQSERIRSRSYARLMTQAQEDERKRIARELHDEASQNLIVIRRGLAAVAASLDDHPARSDLDELRDLASQTVAAIRRFSRDLRPPTLDELGVSSALEQLVIQVRERSGVAVKLRVTGAHRRLSAETELAVFRIGQAALHNVERHAAASSATLELAFDAGTVRLLITDDGCGFDLPESLDDLPEAGKLGLVGMRERAQLVGGTLRISSRQDSGTRVELEVSA